MILLGLMLCFFGSCHPETSNVSGTEVIELREYETIYALEESQFDSTTLISPTIITYDGKSNLFVYDRTRGMVVELDGSGNVVGQYGRKGRGPGEFQFVNNIILAQSYVYLVDHWQFFIHKYNRDGVLISSMDYGSITTGGVTLLNMLSSIVAKGIQAMDVSNRPFITHSGNVLLPLERDKVRQTIYELRDWQGNYLTDIGKVPEASMYLPEGGDDVYLSSIENREIPQIFKPRAFPVSDQSNPGEIFLVYSAIPSIVKYDTSGTKLWKREIPPTPEVNAISRNYFDSMEKQNKMTGRRSGGTNIGVLRKYTSGVSSPEGDLYLATYTDPDSTVAFSELAEPLWIHQFSGNGELIRRYKLISGSEIVLPSIFDIDFSGYRIFVVTKEAEIRAYSF